MATHSPSLSPLSSLMVGLYNEQIKHIEGGDSAYFEGVELDILQTAKSSDGNSLLIAAALEGHVSCCRVICKRCPQLLYQTNSFGRSAMHVAASEGKEEIIKFLQDIEQDVKSVVDEEIDYKLSTMPDQSGNTALHLAAHGGHFSSAKLLLDADHPNDLLRILNRYRETALHLAVKFHHFQTVKLLVEADPEFDYFDVTAIAFNMAVSKDDEKVKIRNLLIRKQPSQCMRRYNSKGQTILHHATYINDIIAVMDIIDICGACSELVDDHRENFLHLATRLGHEGIVKYILSLEHISDTVLNGMSCRGETPLHIAISSGNKNIALLLLYDSRVDKTIKNSQGRNVLELMEFNYDMRRARVLRTVYDGIRPENIHDEQFKHVKEGDSDYFKGLALDILQKAKTSNGNSLLIAAVLGRQLRCCEVICKRYPQILYQTNNDGSTAMHVAAEEGEEEIIKFLFAVEEKIKDVKSGVKERTGYSLSGMQDIQGLTALHLAAQENHPLSVKLLLASDPSNKLLGVVNYQEETALHLAVKLHHFETVKVLVKADPHFQYSDDRSGNTPLFVAFQMAMSGDTKTASIRRFLIKNQRAQCTLPIGKNNWTLLHHATDKGDLETVQDIIDFYPDLCVLVDEEGRNVLHLAAQTGQVEVVKYFLTLKNIDDNVLNGKDKWHNTSLHVAVASNNYNIASCLLGDSRVNMMHTNIQGKIAFDMLAVGNQKQWTLLHYPAQKGNINAIKEILKFVPNCFDAVDEEGHNFLHVAAMYNKIEVVEYCLELTTFTTNILNWKDIHGNTPLQVAISCGNQHIASAMLQDGRIDATVAQNMGPSVLFRYARKGDIDFFRSIQVDVLRNSKDEDGESVLSTAAREGHLNCCKVICDQCPELLYQTNKNGASALHMVSSNGKQDIVKYLLGAQVGEGGKNTKLLRMIDNREETAMHYAVRNHNFEIVQLLLDADPAFKYSNNKSGHTPAFLALQEVHSDDPSFLSIGKIRKLLIKNSCEHRDEKRHTLLHHATIQNNLSAIREIIDSSEECMELVDNKGESFLHLAAGLGYGRIVEYIVGLKNISDEFLNEMNHNKETPLHIAISTGDQNVVLPLLYDSRVKKGILDRQGNNVLKSIKFSYNKRRAEVSGLMDEKDLKDQSDFDLLVGALISTMAFTAGITVPGGFIPDGPNRGNAILYRKHTFEAFVISNAIALALSLFAVFTHFCMKHLVDEKETTIQLRVATVCSVGSIYALMIAFVMGSFSVLSISPQLAIAVSGIGVLFFGCSFYSLWRMIRNKQKHRH